jgi:type I pantothenate kinase
VRHVPRERSRSPATSISTRAEWARLRAATPLPLSEAQLRPLGGVTERVSLDEVSDVYLPLSRLLNLYRRAQRRACTPRRARFSAGRRNCGFPSSSAVAGSVAVGKSTTSESAQSAAVTLASHPKVDLVTTDGFLIPQRALEAQGLAHRKRVSGKL